MDDTHPENDLRVASNDGVKHVTTRTKAVRNAMTRGGAESHRQKALNQAENNWKGFMSSTDTGLHRIGQAASTGAQSDLMDSACWGWSCTHYFLFLQEKIKGIIISNFKKWTTGKNRLPQPGQLNSYLETVKAENS